MTESRDFLLMRARAKTARNDGERGRGVYITFGRLVMTPDEAIALADDNAALLSVIDRVLALHTPITDAGNEWCRACTTAWPCETRQTLETP